MRARFKGRCPHCGATYAVGLRVFEVPTVGTAAHYKRPMDTILPPMTTNGMSDPATARAMVKAREDGRKRPQLERALAARVTPLPMDEVDEPMPERPGVIESMPRIPIETWRPGDAMHSTEPPYDADQFMADEPEGHHED